jgi:capsular polysaccharide biosynthesis protein
LELREYWAILARRWQLICVVTAIAFVAGAVMVMLGPNSYKSEIRMTISIKSEPRQGNYYMYDNYYTWLTSEYMVDDIGEVMKSDAFAKDVAARLGNKVPAAAIKRDTKPTKTHRILSLAVTTDSPALSEEIAQAMKDTMEAQADTYFAQLGTQNAMLRVIDGPTTEPEMGLARRAIEIALRTAVGLLAAVALAFLLHYVDPTVRTAGEAERQLGLPVLAEIPR